MNIGDYVAVERSASTHRPEYDFGHVMRFDDTFVTIRFAGEDGGTAQHLRSMVCPAILPQPARVKSRTQVEHERTKVAAIVVTVHAEDGDPDGDERRWYGWSVTLVDGGMRSGRAFSFDEALDGVRAGYGNALDWRHRTKT